jgi:hypothetical protein
VQQQWPEPAWIAELQERDRPAAKVRYYLNLAAAFHSEDGGLPALSEALGRSKPHLNVCRQRGRVSPEIAVEIETVLGRENFPRELFNDIFTVTQK